MKRAASLRLALVALAVAASAACRTAPGVRGPTPGAAKLYAQLQERAARGPQVVLADAKAFIDAPQDGGRYALHLAVQRPDSLRLEALTPFGDPAAVLVTSHGRFGLLDLRHGDFLRGPARPDNLARLLPIGLRPEELVDLMTGGLPGLPGGQPVRSERAGDAIRITLEAAAPDGAVLVEEALLAGDLRVTEVRRFLRRGSSITELWQVRVDRHDERAGAQIPTALHAEAKSRHTQLDLVLSQLEAGKPPPSGAFRLDPPAGTRVEELP